MTEDIETLSAQVEYYRRQAEEIRDQNAKIMAALDKLTADLTRQHTDVLASEEAKASALQGLGLGYAYTWYALVAALESGGYLSTSTVEFALIEQAKLARQRSENPEVLRAIQHCLELVQQRPTKSN